MKAYFLSVGVGILVGIVYGILNVKSPAPPVIALFGLFGMLGGEQMVKHFHDWRAAKQAARASVIMCQASQSPPADPAPRTP